MAENIKLEVFDLPFNILTDLAGPDEWAKRLDQARNRTPALDDLMTMIETRRMKTQFEEDLPLPAEALSVAQAELFYYLVREIKPVLSVETGFHFGLAASIITLAHMANGIYGGHIPMQRKAKEVETGIGYYTLERLDLSGYQIMEHEPALVLPQIYLQQLNEGLSFAYFNSAESFEEQMMEYFYINMLLNEGGVMAINMGAPARVELLDYIRKNRHDYAVRVLDCGIALVQKPAMSALANYPVGFRH